MNNFKPIVSENDFRPVYSNSKGGFTYNNKKNLGILNKYAKNFLASLAKGFITGQVNILKIAIPIYINQPVSYLQT